MPVDAIYTTASNASTAVAASGRRVGPFTTYVFRMKDGYVAQVSVDGQILWESKPKKTVEKAYAAGNRRISKSLTTLFGG